MWTGKLKGVGVAIPLALACLALVSCGSDGGGDSTVAKRPVVHADTARHLANLSDDVASDLDAGDTCGAAYAADQLQAAVEEANLPASMRPSVEEAAGRLVDQVNCPPPPPTSTTEGKKKHDEAKHEDKEQSKGEDHGGEHGPEPPGHGGKVPPGQAKLKGGTE
jgi:hypothetical protein